MASTHPLFFFSFILLVVVASAFKSRVLNVTLSVPSCWGTFLSFFFFFVFLFSFFFFYNIFKWSFFFFFSDPLTRQVSFFPFFPSSRSVPIFLIAQNWFIQLVKKALPESLLSEEIVRVLTLPLFFLLFLFFFFAFWKVEANVSLPPCNQWCSNDPRKTVVSWRYSSAFLQYLFFLSFFFRFYFCKKKSNVLTLFFHPHWKTTDWDAFLFVFDLFLCVLLLFCTSRSRAATRVHVKIWNYVSSVRTQTHIHTHKQQYRAFLLLLFCIVLMFCPFNWIWRRVWTIIVKNFVFPPFFVCNPNRAFRVVFELVFFFFLTIVPSAERRCSLFLLLLSFLLDLWRTSFSFNLVYNIQASQLHFPLCNCKATQRL